MSQKRLIVIALLIIAIAIFYACNKGLEIPADQSFGSLHSNIAVPIDNPQSPDKILLGRMLFFDPILSGTREVSCATCHNPKMGFADSLDLPIGVNGAGSGSNRHFLSPNSIPFTKRNTPTLLNVAFNGIDVSGTHDPVIAPMFFDNRVQSLEKQALQPIAALEEMRGTGISATAIFDTVVARVRGIPQYLLLFQNAFGRDVITIQMIAKALASYERTLIAINSPFDRYVSGDLQAMTDQQKRGMVLFTQNGCNSCHSGPMFSDYKVHILGVVDNNKLSRSDAGKDNTYAFRTPTLRNLRYTAPYMHNGTQKSLEDILSFYDVVTRGGAINANIKPVQLDLLLRGRVTRSKDLIAFLDALNSDEFDTSFPLTVPSGLPVGGNIR